MGLDTRMYLYCRKELFNVDKKLKKIINKDKYKKYFVYEGRFYDNWYIFNTFLSFRNQYEISREIIDIIQDISLEYKKVRVIPEESDEDDCFTRGYVLTIKEALLTLTILLKKYLLNRDWSDELFIMDYKNSLKYTIWHVKRAIKKLKKLSKLANVENIKVAFTTDLFFM